MDYGFWKFNFVKYRMNLRIKKETQNPLEWQAVQLEYDDRGDIKMNLAGAFAPEEQKRRYRFGFIHTPLRGR